MREDLRNNPGVVYLFGDNCKRIGLGGQAKEMRGEPNAIGIVTKLTPWLFMSDDIYDYNVHEISLDFNEVYKAIDAETGKIVVIPADGIGTGLADLKNKAPRTYEYLQQCLESLKS